MKAGSDIAGESRSNYRFSPANATALTYDRWCKRRGQIRRLRLGITSLYNADLVLG